MKIIINTTVIQSGGGLQVTLSFLNELKSLVDDRYYVFLSSAVEQNINQESFPSNFQFILFDKSPAHLGTRYKIVTELNKATSDIKPDFVFSVFGPTYWRPKALHIMGFAVPHILYHDYEFVRSLNLRSRLEFLYKRYELKANADHYITETEDASDRLRIIINNKSKKVFTVGNTYGSHFDNQILDSSEKRFSTKFTLITISTSSKHKNLKIIKNVLQELEKLKVSICFVLTIKKNEFNEMFGENHEGIVNIGPVEPLDCPALYRKADALFLPTLLEVFTASYPEAMKMKKPILTSNLGFAKDICRDAALYFDPKNPKNIAETILELYSNSELQNRLILNGEKRLKDFPTARERASAYIQIGKNLKQHNF